MIESAVFDLDGVVTDTAVIHFGAWKKTFDAVIEAQLGPDAPPFEHDSDYVPYVDGKPRYDGVATFLSSRGIDLPYGEPTDTDDQLTVCGIGNRKNSAFTEILESGDVPIFQSTVALVDALLGQGVPCGVASSSKNCRPVLRQTGLIGRFETVVDGTDIARLGMSGKPAPDMFVTAAEHLGATPAGSIVFEDAYVGVEAGRNGDFGLVVGIARNGDTDGLIARGAHVAVKDLSELSLADLMARFED